VKRIAIVSSRYPTGDQPYNHMFVHARARQYARVGMNVNAFVPSATSSTYQIDGIPVYREPSREIARKLESYDLVAVHLLHLKPDRALSGEPVFDALKSGAAPSLLFLHGVEVQPLRFRRREDIALLNPLSIGRWLYHDFWRLPRFARIIEGLMTGPTRFGVVVPSRWFQSEAERGIGFSLGDVVSVIPNGIDTERFAYIDPKVGNNSRVLSIRPLYRGGKYAVDLALRTFQGWDCGLTLSLYGAGPDADWVQQQVRGLKPRNVDLRIGFLRPDDIPAVHSEHAIYLGVTRLDAQGVSMCEAMASGLPVVSFAIDAVPEFVEHGVSGYLADPFDLEQVRDYLSRLSRDPELRLRFSVAARDRMQSISIDRTCAMELRIGQRLRSQCGTGLPSDAAS
jgi:glycosyltransferase involved in cell wall biosynthesis